MNFGKPFYEKMGVNIKRLLPIIPQMTQIMSESKGQMWQVLFNVMLVWVGARKAFFADTGIDDRKMFHHVLATMNATSFTPKIKIRDDLWLVYTNPAFDKVQKPDDKTLAKWLGFNCVGHTFYDQSVDRIGVRIFVNDQNVYAEYCVASSKNPKRQLYKLKRFALKKSQRYEQVARLFGWTTSYEVDFEPGIGTRVANINNDAYIHKYFYHYANNVGNDWRRDGFIQFNTWDDVKQAGLGELFKFAFWFGTRWEVFDQMFNSTKDLEGMYRDIEHFEKDLIKSKLLGVDFKYWIVQPEFASILKRQKPFIQEAFSQFMGEEVS
jgi:hypothetical protein